MSELLNESTPAQVQDQAPTPTNDFLACLPDDLKNEPSLGSFKDITALAKSFVSAQRMLGNSVRIPTDDSAPEAKAEFFKKLETIPGVVRLPEDNDIEGRNQLLTKLGRPATADEYKLDLPEGTQEDPTQLAEFKKLAFELGLNKKQAQELTDFNMKIKQSEHENLVKIHATNEASIKEKWGQDFDNRLTAAKLVVRSYAEKMPDEVKALVNSPLGNNPALLQILADFGKSLHETQALTGSEGLKFGTTPQEALEKISEIQSNRGHAFHNAKDPGHNVAVEKMHRLYEAAYGSQTIEQSR